MGGFYGWQLSACWWRSAGCAPATW
ncbi:expressed unknown protein [Ectocarpus siliculosus]|uniref:Uncharacterized protein n=1 Tax=Ectocarpus siliculosus TaxID=2880 RepID=D7FMW1_ECTSI|nr:expressed unknown protein [Ectocarpus siliculosus]|eukprot:CBJ30025.1 expressed unknown protein [Ectocarpus siliculosus]